MSVPVTSVGIRSGVNWMRLKSSPKAWARVRTMSVLAVPGKPVIRQWPPMSVEISNCSMIASWPTTMRPSASRMAVMVAWKCTTTSSGGA